MKSSARAANPDLGRVQTTFKVVTKLKNSLQSDFYTVIPIRKNIIVFDRITLITNKK